MAEEKKPYIIDGQRVTLEEYRKTKFEDLRVRVPKGKKQIKTDYLKTTCESLNSFVNKSIDEKKERDQKKS